MKCDKCGRQVDSRTEEIAHLLDQHADTITSHEKDELKREMNRLEDEGGSGSLPVRKLGVAAAVLAVIVGGGYALSAAGIVSFSAGGSGPASAAVGPAGSTHDHAQFSVVLNGEEIDFSQPRYQYRQTQNPRIHFEGGDGSTIHKHATGVTIGYALDRHGMGINATCLTVDDTAYCEDETASLSVTVNDNDIQDAASHVIRDGEIIRIEYSMS